MTTSRVDGRTLALSGLLGVALSFAFAPTSLAAQQTFDARWLPWVGCWESVGMSADDAMLCVRPLQDGTGVEMLTLAAGVLTSTEIIVADGVERAVDREGCRGTEASEFSRDGRRLFVRSDYECEGSVPRSATGLIAMASPNEWLDVRAIGVDGEASAWLQRYQRARAGRAEEAGLGDLGANRSLAIDAARRVAARSPDVDDIIEASAHVDAEAVRTWVAEVARPLDLDASGLIRMADAGVSDAVIDVVVAVSFPERFAIAQDARPEARTRGLTSGSIYGYAPYYDPFFGRYYRSSFYSPFGLNAYGGYGGYYGYGYRGYLPTVIVVEPRGADGSSPRVVRGRGYTRGSGSASGGGSAARGSSGSRPAARSRPSGSSRPPTRRAKPRGGGGGGGSGF